MTALSWEVGTSAVWRARLGGFGLFVQRKGTAAQWSVSTQLNVLALAEGPATSVDEAKRAAEAWLRLHLHDLLRQLRDPDAV
jgi:hypothetical protein